MQVALATSSEFPNLDPDDAPLVAALERRGLEPRPLVWDDPRCDWAATPICIIRSTWDYFDRPDEFRAWAERVGAVTELWNRAETIRWNSDKRYLRELGDHGVPTVPTLWLEPGSDVDIAYELAMHDWGSAIVKPAIDGGARRLMRVGPGEADAGAAQAHVDTLLAGGAVLVQPFVESIERDGELSIVFVDGHFTHAVRKRPADDDFRVQPEWGGTNERVDPAPREHEAAGAVLTAAGRDFLYARVDLVGGHDGEPLLVELEVIEPRLFLRSAPDAAEALADAVAARLA